MRKVGQVVFLAIKIPDPQGRSDGFLGNKNPRSCEFYRTSSSPGGGDCTLKLGEPENVHHVSCLGVSPKTHEAKQACGDGIIPPEPSRKGCNFRRIGDFYCQENHLTYLACGLTSAANGTATVNIGTFNTEPQQAIGKLPTA